MGFYHQALARFGESNCPAIHSRYFIWASLAITLAVFIGFSRTWFFQPWTGAPALPISLHLHGLVATAWVLLFLTQAVLIDQHRVNLHRQLGIFGALIAVVLATSAIAIAIGIAREHGGTPYYIDRLAIQCVVALTFLLLVGLGIAFRHNREAHKRYMLCATIQAATPAIGRFPVPEQYLIPIGLTMIAALLISLIVHDLRTIKKVHKGTIVGVSIVALSLPGRKLLGTTEFWNQLAARMLN